RLSLAPLAGRIDAAFVFGSMASGTESAGSDIDLMVVGDAGFAEIVDATYAAQATLGREINPKVMSASEWQAKKAERNAFLQDVLNKPRIMLIGDADAL
ncbi:MAG: nucleotidyltransferase domain-containing protein, partial [Thauera sp.]